MRKMILFVALVILLMPSNAFAINKICDGEGTFSETSQGCIGNQEVRFFQSMPGTWYWEVTGVTKFRFSADSLAAYSIAGTYTAKTKVGVAEYDIVNNFGTINRYGALDTCLTYNKKVFNPGTTVPGNSAEWAITVYTHATTLYHTVYCDYCTRNTGVITYSLDPPTTISGKSNCSDTVDIYKYDGAEYIYSSTNTTCNYNYSFSIYNNTDYKLVFLDEQEYCFSGNNTDMVYNYDACMNSTFNLFDDCSNPLTNATTTIFRNSVEQIYQGTDNPIIIYAAGNYDRYDQFKVIIDTHDMAVEKVVYADGFYDVFNLYHQSVGWDLQTIVYDNFTKNVIEGVKVSINQTCRIGGYDPITHGFTNENGLLTTYQLSDQNFSIKCEHGDYHDYFSLFVSNFDAQKSTYMVEIYLDNSSSEYEDGNETLPETPCSITWSNNDNLIIHEINDTEDARLHYMAGSTTTLLYFERWSEVSDTWVLIGSSHTLTPLEQGYIQYTPINWTEDETTIYRGRLWALNCYCDTTSSLKVWNSTDINEFVFKNLTANVRFKDKISGSEVSPVSPILIKAYAASNNTTLLTIDLKLYNESALVETESLSFFDWYIDGSFAPYRWYPEYTYTDGYNYTVKMFGIGNALLDVDTVYANSSSPLFDNYELTVFVLDNYNHQVTHSTVFVEGWGSISTGDKYYVSIAGFPQGTYQYKATKAGYISSGWASIELNNHESVNCVLVSETQTSIIASKMTNAEIKAFFIPLMYLMLIMMLLGAFKFACGGK